MVKLVNQTIFSSKIKEKKLPIFGVADICSLFGLSRTSALKLLHRYSRRGFILRLKRGTYTLADIHLPVLFVANKLYEPSYVSREFALSYHRVIPETVYEITSVTPKATRLFEKTDKIFSYRKIVRAAFTGYAVERQSGLSFIIADPEKAFVDTNYFRLLDGLDPLARYDKKKIDPAKALKYAVLFGNRRLNSIIRTTLT